MDVYSNYVIFIFDWGIFAGITRAD